MGESGIPATWPNPWKILTNRSDLTVSYVGDLPRGMHGFWSPRHRLILLREGLSMIERRWALMHELGHVENEHWCDEEDELLTEALEEEADQWAARKILPIRLLRAAAHLPPHRASAALYLPAAAIRARMQHLHPAERHLVPRALARRREDTE